MPKKNRLRRQEFPLRGGKRIVGGFFSLSYSPAVGSLEPKFSCVVSKKIAKRAVDRNTLKRRCREIFRPLLARALSMHIVVYPKKSALEVSYAELSRDATSILGKMST